MNNDIIHSDTYAELLGYQDHLESESSQSRVFASLYKGTGLAGIGLSAMALVTLPGWGGLALAGAAVGYVGSVLVESRKTGKLMPLPFVGLGLETVLKGVAKASNSVHGNDDGDDLTNYHYLDAQQKSDYALLLLFSVEIATYLETLPSDTARRVAFAQMRRRFHQNYARYTKESPDLLAMGSDKQSVVDFLLADADKLRYIATQPMSPALPDVAEVPELPVHKSDLDYTQTVEVPIVEDSDSDPWQDSDIESPIPVQTQLAPVANPVVGMESAYTQTQDIEAIRSSVQPSNIAVPPELNTDGYSPVVSMTDHIQNTAIIGKGGSGKGILLSNAILEAAKANPNLKIVGIDPKNDPDETNYWNPCYKVFRKTVINMDADAMADWINSAIDYYFQLPAPKLLVIDECRFLSMALQQCEDKKAFSRFWYRVDSFTSLGDSQESHVWIVSQTAHASDLGISGGCRSMFRCVALVTGEDPNYLEALTATRFVPPPPRGIKQLNQIIGDSPVNRAIYDSKQSAWLPLARMANYSAKDRDTRTRIPQNEVSTPVESNQFTPTVNTQLSFLEVEPERIPSQVQVMDEPSLDSLVVEDIGLDSLFADEPIKSLTPDLDRRIDESKQSSNIKVKCLGELLEWLKTKEDGFIFNNANVNNSGWCSGWHTSQPEVMPSKAKESFLPFIEAAIKLDFLIRESNTSYRVNLH